MGLDDFSPPLSPASRVANIENNFGQHMTYTDSSIDETSIYLPKKKIITN